MDGWTNKPSKTHSKRKKTANTLCSDDKAWLMAPAVVSPEHRAQFDAFPFLCLKAAEWMNEWMNARNGWGQAAYSRHVMNRKRRRVDRIGARPRRIFQLFVLHSRSTSTVRLVTTLVTARRFCKTHSKSGQLASAEIRLWRGRMRRRPLLFVSVRTERAHKATPFSFIFSFLTASFRVFILAYWCLCGQRVRATNKKWNRFRLGP